MSIHTRESESGRGTVRNSAIDRLSTIRPSQMDRPSDVSNRETVNSLLGSSRLTYSLKLILLGNSVVGKTTLFSRYFGDSSADKYNCTISVSCKSKLIVLDQTTSAQLEIWDTAGEEKFRSLTRQYYKQSDGVILMFDLTQRDTFSSLPLWLKDIKENGSFESEIVIVGNKMDLFNSRAVGKEEAEKFALERGCSYHEISAKTGNNIDLLFEKIAYAVAKKTQAKKDLEEVNQKQEDFLKKNAQKMKAINKKSDVGCCK